MHTTGTHNISNNHADFAATKHYYLGTLVTLIRTAFLVLLFVVALGSGLNYHALKYSSSRGTACERGVLTLNIPHSHHCCDSSVHFNDWVCSATYDPINKVVSSKWGYAFAFLPFLLNSVVDLMQASSITSHLLAGILKRFFFYVSLYVFRKLCLYDLLNAVQDFSSGANAGKEVESEFWAKDFVSPSKWDMTFDFSDHIVLFVVVFVIPCVLELHYSITRMLIQGTAITGGDEESNGNEEDIDDAADEVSSSETVATGGGVAIHVPHNKRSSKAHGSIDSGRHGDQNTTLNNRAEAKKDDAGSTLDTEEDRHGSRNNNSISKNGNHRSPGTRSATFHPTRSGNRNSIFNGRVKQSSVLSSIGIWQIAQSFRNIGYYRLPAVISVCLLAVVMRQILFTCMFFHTPAENFVGLGLSIVAVLFFGIVVLGAVIAFNNTS